MTLLHFKVWIILYNLKLPLLGFFTHPTLHLCACLAESKAYSNDGDYDVTKFKHGKKTGTDTKPDLTTDFGCEKDKVNVTLTQNILMVK